MRPLYFFGVIFMFFFNITAQEHSNLGELLKETEGILYSQPAEALKISQYVVSKTENPRDVAAANIIAAKASYAMGHYNDAAKFSLQAKKIAKNLDNKRLKLNIDLFTIKILRELGFEFLADNYVDDLNNIDYQNNIKNNDSELQSWLIAKLDQDEANKEGKLGNFNSARNILNRTTPVFQNRKDTFSINEVNLVFSELYLAQNKLDSANYYLQKILTTTQSGKPKSFQELEALNQIANIYFLKKDFIESQNVYQQVYQLSQDLPNLYYKHRSLQGLMTTSLALDESEKYIKVKVLQNSTTIEVDEDRAYAMNSVYNFINESEKRTNKNIISSEYKRIYIIGFSFLFLLGLGLLLNYYLNIKTAQYKAIWKYIKPVELHLEINESTSPLEKSSIVPEEIELQLLEKLKKFEKGTKFTQPEMSIAMLASKFDTNTKYLSEVINRQKGKNFNAYINELRINYIIEKLRTNKIYSQYKISYLAEECGFASHSSFATVFKSITGLSPTGFIDLLKK